VRAAPVVAALLAACASHERPPDAQATPREQLARSLGLELPDCAGPDRPAGGRAVWISLDGIHTVEGDTLNSATVEPLAGGAFVEKRPNHLIGKLYDAVAPDETPAARPAIAILADRRVPMTTVIDVLYTLGRAGYTAYHLACGSAEQPSALAITPRMFGGLEPRRDPPPVRAVRSDIALKWDDSGARAWALPRRAEDPPFAPRDEDMFYDSALPPPRELPTRVPLVLEGGADPTLSPEGVAQLTAALCRFNDAPFGVELAPHAATPYAELLRLGAAATSRCGGPRQLIFLDDPEPRTGAMTVEGLKTLRREP
jgi:hypothetical protein